MSFCAVCIKTITGVAHMERLDPGGPLYVLCRSCRTEPVRDGTARPVNPNMNRHAESQARYRETARLLGKCVTCCRRPAQDGRTRCEQCDSVHA